MAGQPLCVYFYSKSMVKFSFQLRYIVAEELKHRMALRYTQTWHTGTFFGSFLVTSSSHFIGFLSGVKSVIMPPILLDLTKLGRSLSGSPSSM